MTEMNQSAAERAERSRPSTAGTAAYLLLGPLLWAAHFTVLYATQSGACAIFGAGAGPVPTIVIVIATLLVLGLMVAAMLKPHATSELLQAGRWGEPVQRFCDRVMALLAGLSLFAVVGAAAGAVLLPSCPPLR